MLRTPLYDWHVAHGGRMVEFGGWEMPVQYTSIVEEHNAVRQAAGLFDISHMGRLRIRGPQAIEFVDQTVTIDVSKLTVGQIRYALVTNEAGGILDDVLVYRLKDDILLVVNASNREKILRWFDLHKSRFDCQIKDLTFSHAMIAVQGPLAGNALEQLGGLCLQFPKLKYYTAAIEYLASDELQILSRTGYTGEDGWELIGPFEKIAFDIGFATGTAKPCGLGARDTLRLEAAMPLYGHELTEEIDPFTAGLDFAVRLDKPDFIGKAALAEIAKRTDRKKRIGLQLAGKRIAREGCPVMSGDQTVGAVTSGTFSPTLDKSIAMAIVEPASAALGTPLEIDIRGKREAATVVPLPFYKRPKTV